MKFHIITIFPEVFYPYLETSIIGRAKKRGLVDFDMVNLRDFTNDKHRSVDDVPFGGGAGMILKVEPIYKAVNQLRITNYELRNAGIGCANPRKKKVEAKGNRDGSKIILLSAKGKKFTQQKARELSQLENIVLICGRYEGVDERVAEHIADEEISIGDYVLTGGELPAMVITDAITRLIPGVIAEESLREESHINYQLSMNNEQSKKRNLEYPQYTRPAVFKTDEGEEWKVPDVLLSGNHKEIEKWRKNV